jgi:D-arabinose 1-dehydrogenase-like Zn-dependent alcohol dehydrogenase
VQAITVRDRDAGVGGLSLTDMPYPHASQNDVIVRVHAGGFTPGELDWPTTWADRSGRDRTPTVPGHELSGVVVELGTEPPASPSGAEQPLEPAIRTTRRGGESGRPQPGP